MLCYYGHMMSHPTKVQISPSQLKSVLKKKLYILFSFILSMIYFIFNINNAPADKECLEQTLNSVTVKVYV